jgi:hypothetical protein
MENYTITGKDIPSTSCVALCSKKLLVQVFSGCSCSRLYWAWKMVYCGNGEPRDSVQQQVRPFVENADLNMYLLFGEQPAKTSLQTAKFFTNNQTKFGFHIRNGTKLNAVKG